MGILDIASTYLIGHNRGGVRGILDIASTYLIGRNRVGGRGILYFRANNGQKAMKPVCWRMYIFVILFYIHLLDKCNDTT